MAIVDKSDIKLGAGLAIGFTLVAVLWCLISKRL
jgi:hypothetical protein